MAKRESFFFRTIEDDLSTIAQYYDTPVLSLRNAVYHLLREQRFGFQVYWDLVAGGLWSKQRALKGGCTSPRKTAA